MLAVVVAAPVKVLKIEAKFAAGSGKRIEDLGMQVVASSPAQFDALLRSEMKRWSKVIADARISLD